MNDQFFVFDDVLETVDHIHLYQNLKKLKWTQGWGSSNDNDDAWHWNYNFTDVQSMPAFTQEELNVIFTNHPYMKPLHEEVNRLFLQYMGQFDVLRMYANCNPYGQNGYIHEDDGDYTAIYYPATEWKGLWEGGTCIYEQVDGDYDAVRYVSYKPNRLMIFPAHMPHRAMPVDKQCFEPRMVVVFKMERNVNDPRYVADFYKK